MVRTTPGIILQGKTVQDFMNENEDRALKRELLTTKASGSKGATIQAAERLMAADPSLDFPTAFSIAKSGLGQGNTYGEGGVTAMENQLQNLWNTENAKAGGKNQSDFDYAGPTEMAKKTVQLQMDPAIAGAEASERKNVELAYDPIIANQTKIQGDRAEKEIQLNERKSSLPQLEETARRLSDLGKVATYTKTGQLVDVVRRETGMEPRESAIARKEYLSLVDNQILPLLRQTFGAQFTQKEGESLKITLGDPNATPEEKDAVLKSFIEQKKATIESLQRELGEQTQAPAMPKTGETVDGFMFMGGNPSDPASWKAVR